MQGKNGIVSIFIPYVQQGPGKTLNGVRETCGISIARRRDAGRHSGGIVSTMRGILKETPRIRLNNHQYWLTKRAYLLHKHRPISKISLHGRRGVHITSHLL